MNDPEFWHVREASRVWGRPWQQLLELHDALPSKSWTLVGGLMVRIHAEHAGVHDSRTTRDVDAVLHLETGVITYPPAVHRLEQLGYEHQEPVGDGPTHRLSRGNEHVDLMVADHLAPAMRPRFRRWPVMAVPGASNTLRYHTVDCVIRREKDTDHRVVFSLPDTLGALSLKGGAYLNDNRDQQRHLEDGAVLLATVDDPRELRNRMQGRDAKRIRALIKGIRDKRIARLFPLDQARHIEQVGEDLARGRIASAADRWKKPSPVPSTWHTGGHPTSSAGLCGHPTTSGSPCRNPAGSCPHHR